MATSGKSLTGLVAATFTPLTPQGEINLSEIEPYIDYLVEKQGVKSIFVNGTTGEGMSLSVEERKTLAEEWCQKGKGKMDQVVVHVGCLSLKESQELARHAVEVGADGIAVIAPSFFKPSTAGILSSGCFHDGSARRDYASYDAIAVAVKVVKQTTVDDGSLCIFGSHDALRRFLQEVASSAPSLPFYYYHIPAVTGVTLQAKDVLAGIEKLIPSFMGVKFSSTDLVDFGLCVRSSQPQWSLLYGVDEQLLGALPMGANGAVGSTYNYIGGPVNQLISAFEKGDLSQARAIQFKVQELITYAKDQGFDVGVNKQLMSQVSGLCLGPPRLPLLPRPHSHALAIAQKYHSLFTEKH